MTQDELVLGNDMQIETYLGVGGMPSSSYFTQKDANRVFIRFAANVTDAVFAGDTKVDIRITVGGVNIPILTLSSTSPNAELRQELHGSLVHEVFTAAANGGGVLNTLGVVIGRITDRSML